jgi:hypothetical protein
MKKILALILVLGLVGMSSAASDGFQGYTLDTSVNGQGAAGGGWASSWIVSHSSEPITTQCTVLAGGSPDDPDQHMGMVALNSSGYSATRYLDTLSGSWSFSFDLQLIGTGTNSRTEAEILLEDATGQNGLQIKVGGTSFEMFQMNNNYMTVQYGDGAFPNMKPLHEGEDWVSFEVQYDAGTQLFSLFWEEQDGTMLQHGPDVDADSASWDGTVSRIQMYGCKTYNGEDSGEGLLVDNINLVPEPMTLSLLGLGGLALLRRKH